MSEVRREWFEKDYYRVLGVADTASDRDITKAYRKLAQQLHPDKNPGDAPAEERFKDVSAAYDVLGDPETRKAYDEARRMGPMGGGGGFGPGGFSVNYDFSGGDLSDLLGSIFGGGGRGGFGGANRPMKGRDQEAQIRLSFDEAANGATIPVTVGASSGTPRSLNVRIPAGVEDGQRIRVRGQGGPGANGGPAGDLFVIVRVAEHPLFGRDGANLTITVPISFPEAALGAKIKVPTFDAAPVTLKLPAGTQSGRTFRVKGRGLEVGATQGDLLVTVEVAVPTKLSKAERDALEVFATHHAESPRAHLGV